MDAEQRRALHDQARARSRVMLDPETARAAIAEEKAATVVHRDDGFSCDWAATMPKQSQPPPLPPRSLTDAEIKRMIAEAFEARQWRDDARRDAVAKFVAQVREQLRKEFAAEVGSLRADLTLARALTYEQPVDRSAEIVDMVQPLQRRQRRG